MAKHPLRVGGCILMLYITGRVIVGFGVRFVIGIFLFLTGVRGIIVAFLYVVALCPNPIFDLSKSDERVRLLLIFFVGMILLIPLLFVLVMGLGDVFSKLTNVDRKFQWLRDPTMSGGLVEIMPFLGVLLFLCIVRVVVLCGYQKQCLGGHRFAGVKRFYT